MRLLLAILLALPVAAERGINGGLKLDLASRRLAVVVMNTDVVEAMDKVMGYMKQQRSAAVIPGLPGLGPGAAGARPGRP